MQFLWWHNLQVAILAISCSLLLHVCGEVHPKMDDKQFDLMNNLPSDVLRVLAFIKAENQKLLSKLAELQASIDDLGNELRLLEAFTAHTREDNQNLMRKLEAMEQQRSKSDRKDDDDQCSKNSCNQHDKSSDAGSTECTYWECFSLLYNFVTGNYEYFADKFKKNKEVLMIEMEAMIVKDQSGKTNRNSKCNILSCFSLHALYKTIKWLVDHLYGFKLP